VLLNVEDRAENREIEVEVVHFLVLGEVVLDYNEFEDKRYSNCKSRALLCTKSGSLAASRLKDRGLLVEILGQPHEYVIVERVTHLQLTRR